MRHTILISDGSPSTFARHRPEQKSRANIIKDDYQYHVTPPIWYEVGEQK